MPAVPACGSVWRIDAKPGMKNAAGHAVWVCGPRAPEAVNNWAAYAFAGARHHACAAESVGRAIQDPATNTKEDGWAKSCPRARSCASRKCCCAPPAEVDDEAARGLLPPRTPAEADAEAEVLGADSRSASRRVSAAPSAAGPAPATSACEPASERSCSRVSHRSRSTSRKQPAHCSANASSSPLAVGAASSAPSTRKKAPKLPKSKRQKGLSAAIAAATPAPSSSK